MFYFPFLALLAYLQLDKESVGILCALLVVDYLLGFIKSIRFCNFRYKIMISGIFAKAVVLIIPMALSGMFIGIKLFDMFGGYVMTIVYLFIIAETISIITNCISIYSGEEFEKPDLINQVAHKVRLFIEKIFRVFE